MANYTKVQYDKTRNWILRKIADTTRHNQEIVEYSLSNRYSELIYDLAHDFAKDISYEVSIKEEKGQIRLIIRWKVLVEL